MLRLVLKDGYGTYAPVNFLENLGLFQRRPELLKNDKYMVKSAVSLQVLDVFLARVLGNPSPSGVTNENSESLKALSDEFGFDGFECEFEAFSREKESLPQGDLCALKDRVDAHDVVIDRLERQLLAIRRQNEMWQRAFEQRSRESQAGFETIGNALREEMRNLDVHRWISTFDEDLKEVKREIASLKEEKRKFERDSPRSGDACERSDSCLRDEVSVLKACESRVTSELNAEIDDISFLCRATVKACIFSWMREKEAKLGRKMVVVTQSSRDIYRWLDPESGDSYASVNKQGAWIEIEFKAPVRVNGLRVTSSKFLSNPRTFDVTFSDGPGSEAKHKVSFVDEEGLKGDKLSVDRNFDAVVTAKCVRIESRGPNWNGTDVLNLGGFELFSPDEAYAAGVFRSIFARDRDHVWDSFDVRARSFDWSELHIPKNNTRVCTFAGKHEWVEVGFLHGRVVLSAYKIQKHENCLRGWSLRASNDRNVPLEEWPVLHRHREAKKTLAVLTFECACSTPFRFFRIVQEEKQWNSRLSLSFKYFDIDGTFIPD